MKAHLAQLVAGEPLSEAQAVDAFTLVMTGQAAPEQVAALLALMQQRGPTVAELTGGARVMRGHVVPVDVPDGVTVIDTCGTGGTHSKVFNISTSAAIVAAAVGRPRGVVVAKHGNNSVTSKSGSANVLQALGVKMPVQPATLTRCLDELGLCFCYAPAHHPAMKHAGPVRKQLGFRTVFNILGPLTNPAGATRQLVGVPDRATAQLVASTLQALGADRAMVVTTQLPSGDRLGELTNFGPVTIELLKDGRIDQTTLDPAALGLPFGLPESVTVDGPDASAAIIRNALAGEPGPARDIVCLNAAAALIVAGLTDDWADGLTLAAEAIDSGAANATLGGLVKLTGEDAAS